MKRKLPKPIARKLRKRYYSSKRSVLDKEYARLRIDFLIANPWCAWGLKQNPPLHIRATEIHHTRGRIGRLYLATQYWVGVSEEAHTWIHNHPAAARALGLVCQLGKWNHFE